MSPPQRRRYLRIRKILDVQVEAEPPPIKARITDLSEGGAFVETDEPYPAETLIGFRLDLPAPEGAVEGRAKVVWSQRELGMGVEFLGLDPHDRDRIRYWVGREGGEQAEESAEAY